MVSRVLQQNLLAGRGASRIVESPNIGQSCKSFRFREPLQKQGPAALSAEFLSLTLGTHQSRLCLTDWLFSLPHPIHFEHVDVCSLPTVLRY